MAFEIPIPIPISIQIPMPRFQCQGLQKVVLMMKYGNIKTLPSYLL